MPKGLPRLVPGAVAVYVVHLVKVNVIGLEPFQTAFAVLPDLVRRKASAVCVGFCQVSFALDGIEDLRGQHHRVPAAAFQCTSTEPVAVRFGSSEIAIRRWLLTSSVRVEQKRHSNLNPFKLGGQPSITKKRLTPTIPQSKLRCTFDKDGAARGGLLARLVPQGSLEETKPDFELLTGLTYAPLRIHLS
jgi:hypothetical protein